MAGTYADIAAQAVKDAEERQFDPPFVLPDSVVLRRDIPYAPEVAASLTLDLFMPQHPPSGVPGVLLLHGGGWRNGTPMSFWRHAVHLAARGWVAACASYRLTPDHTFPTQMHDTQAAVRWLRRHAQELGVDPQRIGAAGSSAGGHLVTLLGTTDAPQDGVSSRVQAVVAFNGVFDMVTFYGQHPAAQALLSDNPDLARAASPHWLADATAAPSLLLHGDADATVPHQQSIAYAARLKEVGVPVELHIEPGTGHGYANRAPYFNDAVARMERFLAASLGEGA